MEGRWNVQSAESISSQFWGPQTSAVNFCEEDYIITHYIAEFFNTLTSFFYIGYGIHGILRYKRQNVHAFSRVNLPYWGLIAVGMGSGSYHMTMKYHTQMADEMSMHLALGCVLVQVFSFQQPPEIARRNTAIIVIGLTTFMIYHCVTDEFILHLIIFFALSCLVSYKVRGIIRTQIKDKEQKKKIGSLLTFATCNAFFAYGLWNIDVNFCPTLTKWKHQIGMPLSILLELHGWWHFLTAISVYCFMAMIEFLTDLEHAESHGVGYAWPAKAVLQDLVPDKFMNGVEAIANGEPTTHGTNFANGYARKSD